MVQILGFFSNTWDSISFSIINGLFIFVAKVYDFMLELIYEQLSFNDEYFNAFSNFANIIYVLAGVFMLFRVVIGLIQMLVDPDKINDKQIGAGKMVTRIIMVIIMLMAFAPNGILFGSTGIFSRIEAALLDENDGLVIRLSTLNASEKNDLSDYKDPIREKTKNSLIENVYAANTLTCYYYNVKNVKNYAKTNASNDVTVNEFYKIIFSLNKKSGYTQMRGLVAGDDVSGNVYYYVSNARVKGGEFGDDFKYSSLPNNRVLYDTDKMFYKSDGIWSWSKKQAVIPKNCPKYIDIDGTGDLALRKDASKTRTTGLLGGYTSPTKMINDINEKYKKDNVTSNNPAVDSHEGEETYSYVDKLKYPDSSILFAQASAASLQECSSEALKDCKEAQTGMFKTPEGNADVTKLIKKDKLDVSFIFSVITGLGLIIYLMFLCIEILVRRLKLFFMEIMAPLPIISYVDPKDKIFDRWLKMYLSTYADLFIKLISIGIAVTLLGIASKNFWNSDGFLLKFFYIVAILVFAKVLPTMISKIFGLDSMGGSFKEISGMAKAAAGFGAGATLGGMVGAASGKGLGRLSGFAKGVAMGAGAGSKGNIFGGAQKIGRSNYLDNYGKARRLNWAQRKMAALSGTLGLPDAYEKAQDEKAVKDNYVNKASKANDEALGTIRKLAGRGLMPKGDKFNALQKAWADARTINAGGHINRYEAVSSPKSDYVQSTLNPGSYVNQKTNEVISAAEYNQLSSESGYRNIDTNEVISAAEYNQLDDWQKYKDNEVVENVKGAEKGAIGEFNRLVEEGNFDALNMIGKDYETDRAKHIAYVKAANTAALQAGYPKHTSDNKGKAETASAKLGAVMDEHETVHKFKQQK